MSPSTVRPPLVSTALRSPSPSKASSSSPPKISIPWSRSTCSNQRPTSVPKLRESATSSSITIVTSVPLAFSDAATSHPM
jgi:hypothetical protein